MPVQEKGSFDCKDCGTQVMRWNGAVDYDDWERSEVMTDRPKRPRDANQLAKFIVDVATGERTACDAPKPQAAGGKVGGARRALALSPEQRSEIARAAAAARWKKTDQAASSSSSLSETSRSATSSVKSRIN